MDIKFAVFVLFIVAVLLTVLLYLGLLGNTVRNAASRLDDIDHNIQSLRIYMSKETYLITPRIESKLKGLYDNISNTVARTTKAEPQVQIRRHRTRTDRTKSNAE